MAYIPTEWHTGDVVTVEKLNKLEGGVEDGYGLTINAVDDGNGSEHLDKKFIQIKHAIDNRMPILFARQSVYETHAEIYYINFARYEYYEDPENVEYSYNVRVIIPNPYTKHLEEFVYNANDINGYLYGPI